MANRFFIQDTESLLHLLHLFILQKANTAVNNFDPDFTMEEPKLTPTDADLLKSMDQMQFKGFSFINPAYHMKKIM